MSVWKLRPLAFPVLAAAAVLAAACAPAAAPSPTVAPTARPAATSAPAARPAATAAATKPAAAAPATAVAKPAATAAATKPAAASTATPVARPAFDEKAIAEFYQGKTLRLIVPVPAGGGYDLTSRLLARYLPAHLPGSPTAIVENRDGAGGVRAANTVYNLEPKDGTVLLNFVSSLVLSQALGQPGIEYDAAKLQWLGASDRDASACLARTDTGVTSLREAIDTGKELAIGTSGPGNDSHDIPALINAFLGTRFKLVPGYQGAARFRLAVETKEIDGYCISFKAMAVNDRQWLEGEHPFARVLAIMGEKTPDHPFLKGVPAAETLAKTDEARRLFRLVNTGQAINKPYAVAPEVPRERVEALRKALADTYADPKFLADAQKANMTVEPVAAEEVVRIVDGVLSTPPALLARLKEISR